MRLLGLIGGMSWENTLDYYRTINEMVNQRLGEWNSAKILLYSVNFEEILPLQNKDEWIKIADIMIDICKKLEAADCSAIVICSNSMHKIADEVERNISIPLIHVVDEAALVIKSEKINTVGLLGTKFTMEGGYYAEKITEKYGLTVFLPNQEERNYIHDSIYNEFARGTFLNHTKHKFLKIIGNLKQQGAQGIILGCTEIPMLIKQDDVDVILFDTLKIHLKAAVNFMLS